MYLFYLGKNISRSCRRQQTEYIVTTINIVTDKMYIHYCLIREVTSDYKCSPGTKYTKSHNFTKERRVICPN